MKILIIEDETPAANRVKKLLATINPEIVVPAICDSIESSIKWLEENPAPDLILMDIELSDGPSFKIFKKTQISSPVIFTTAYDKFAIEAIKLGALDYLLKPIEKNELSEAIARVENYNSAKAATILKAQQQYIESITAEGKPKKLAIRNSDGIIFVEIDKIVKLKADSNYAHIFLKDGKQLTASKTLKDFEELLSEYGFFRVHSAHLVNLSYIEKYIKGEGGFVVMCDGSSIEVSRDKKKALLALLSIN
ncbi:MAG TPA: LytTR family DNA-binding domain-containing protein [Bacteroidia bacterium]|jgi:two-component system LytT family response regulator|nr:LytTR family DNA-binding domain-containing protein [Bacteroidia bacterium]